MSKEEHSGICECNHNQVLHDNMSGKCNSVETKVYDPMKDGDVFAETRPCRCKHFILKQDKEEF